MQSVCTLAKNFPLFDYDTKFTQLFLAHISNGNQNRIFTVKEICRVLLCENDVGAWKFKQHAERETKIKREKYRKVWVEWNSLRTLIRCFLFAYLIDLGVVYVVLYYCFD